MAKVITFSRLYPAYHPKAGQPTYFVEKTIASFRDQFPSDEFRSWKYKVSLDFLESLSNERFKPKHHTIREGHRFKEGDYFSPRVWGTDINPKTGRIGPYHSKQIIFSPNVLIKKTWDFKINSSGFCINDYTYSGELESHHELLEEIAANDGLDKHDLLEWFKSPKPFDGQIICWNKEINY